MPVDVHPGVEAPVTHGTDGGIACAGLRLVRRRRLLLDDLTVTVAAGDTLAVMGPSGAGKTTLLRTLAGLDRPHRSEVQRPPGRVAMVFQEPRLAPWCTALENVELVLAPAARADAAAWLERVGLGDALHVYPAALSGGMRQRVAVARALAVDASVVLVDEPFSNLDVATASALRDDLTAHLRALGRTTVWVTHDAREAATVAARTLWMAGPPSGRWTLVDDPVASGPIELDELHVDVPENEE